MSKKAKKKIHEPEIYRCPFCSRIPTVQKAIGARDFMIHCTQINHAVRVNAKSRMAVIQRWNGGR